MIVAVIVWSLLAASAAALVTYIAVSDDAARKYKKLNERYRATLEDKHALTERVNELEGIEKQRDIAQIKLRRIESFTYGLKDDGMVNGAAVHDVVERVVA